MSYEKGVTTEKIEGKVVSFTGHRPDSLGGYDKNAVMNIEVRAFLVSAIDRLRERGFRKFISGGALGVDLWAAGIVLNYPDNELIMAIPFSDYGSNWVSQEDKDQLADFCKRASKTIYVCEGSYFEDGKPQKWKNHARNEWMKENSEIIVAVWNGSRDGGTASAVRGGKKAGKEFIRYNPLTKQEEPVHA